jgi:hypothetical protein
VCPSAVYEGSASRYKVLIVDPISSGWLTTMLVLAFKFAALCAFSAGIKKFSVWKIRNARTGNIKITIRYLKDLVLVMDEYRDIFSVMCNIGLFLRIWRIERYARIPIAEMMKLKAKDPNKTNSYPTVVLQSNASMVAAKDPFVAVPTNTRLAAMTRRNTVERITLTIKPIFFIPIFVRISRILSIRLL